MKKILASLLAVLVLCGLLSGCGLINSLGGAGASSSSVSSSVDGQPLQNSPSQQSSAAGAPQNAPDDTVDIATLWIALCDFWTKEGSDEYFNFFRDSETDTYFAEYGIWDAPGVHTGGIPSAVKSVGEDEYRIDIDFPGQPSTSLYEGWGPFSLTVYVKASIAGDNESIQIKWPGRDYETYLPHQPETFEPLVPLAFAHWLDYYGCWTNRNGSDFIYFTYDELDNCSVLFSYWDSEPSRGTGLVTEYTQLSDDVFHITVDFPAEEGNEMQGALDAISVSFTLDRSHFGDRYLIITPENGDPLEYVWGRQLD